MACGTGKTFTALRVAEAVAGVGGRVLYLVPSISLFAQTMREWATQKAVPHSYVGVCSDTRAGRSDEDASLQELEIPVTTDPAAVSRALREARPGAMTAVFCTYQSLAVVARAQDAIAKDGGAPAFDLVLCDEAHRTTGVERPGDAASPFVLVHDAQRIRARKRLYMTATPRLYTEGAKAKAARHDVDVFSMDDPATYGPEFHRLAFSRAVERDLLSDYKVVVLAMSEERVDAALQALSGLGRQRDQHHRRGQDPRLLEGAARPREPARRGGPPFVAGHRLHQHHRRIQAPGRPLGRRGGPRCRPRPRIRAPLPLRDPPRRRPAPRARAQGADRMAQGRLTASRARPTSTDDR